MEPLPTREDYIYFDLKCAHQKIREMEEKIVRLEYLVHRLSIKFPEIEEGNCAGCKYLVYGRRATGEKRGMIVPMCTCSKKGLPYLRSLASTNGGCFYWERRVNDDDRTV